MHIRYRIFAGVLVGLSVLAILIAFSTSWYVQHKERVKQAGFTQIADAGLQGVFTDRHGAVVSLDEYRGKKLVVFSWASWCPECGDELHFLSKIAVQHPTDVTVLAMNRKENIDLMNDYLAYIGEPQGLHYIIDTTDIAFTVGKGYAMPEFVIYDELGEEIYHMRGSLTESEIQSVLDAYIFAPQK